MLDIRFIQENTDLVGKVVKEKNINVNVHELLELHAQHGPLLRKVEELRAQRNRIAEESKDGSPSQSSITKGKAVKEELNQKEKELKANEKWQELIWDMPNIFPEDTPLGGEEANRQERKWGEASPKNFEVVDHVTWAESRDLLDFERGAKVAGNKFYFTKGGLVELEIAILQLGLKLAKLQGFVPMMVPHMVSNWIIKGTGFMPRGEESQIYRIQRENENENQLNLIATAEIPLTGYHADETLAETDLPKLYAGYSPAYRLEAGAYGKHSKGLYRVHQFNKLELYVYCKPEDSEQWHQKLLALEESLCQTLEIPYRVVRIAAGELGAPAYKKYDVEYWSPVDKAYRELMSCSNVTDYQARRLNIRYKDVKSGTNFVHTLNATAAAMSRVPIAIIENFQAADGTVQIPKSLQPYLDGKTTL